MSYGDTTTPAPTPADTLAAINLDRVAVARAVAQAHRTNWLRVWRNPEFTPQQMWAAIGTGGMLALQDAGAAFAFCNRILPEGDPDYVTLGVPDGSEQYFALGVTSTFAYAVDPATGVVTLTETPYVPPAPPADDDQQGDEA